MPRRKPPSDGSRDVTKEIFNVTADIGMNQFISDLSVELRVNKEGTPNKSAMVRIIFDDWIKANAHRLDASTVKRYHKIRKIRGGG
jgi:hypothetical protein